MSSLVNNREEARPVSTNTYFLGIVKQVLSGDTIMVRDRPINGPPPERTIILSNISCGRVARKPSTGVPTGTSEDPFAWEAREFVRTLLIGKEVCYSIETEQPSGRKYGCVYVGKNISGENVALSLVEQGLAEVRKLNPTVAAKNKVYQQLVTAQEQAKSLGKGRWSPNPPVTREILWSVENIRSFFESYKNRPLKAVVENVRDGCSVQVFILPESLNERPNTFVYLTVTMSGIKCPSIRYEDGKIVPDAWGLDALFFTESRLLQRDVTILLESVFNQTFVGSILHPNGNIAELLLRHGLAHCIDWNLNLVSVPGAAEAYKIAERFAKEKRLRVFENYQPTQTAEVHSDSLPTVVPGKIFSGVIGLGLLAFGVGFLCLGVLFFFDGALLALGNVLFLGGIGCLIGLQKACTFFFRRTSLKGAVFFFGGITVVLFGFPFIGILLEIYGMINLFSKFIPVAIKFLYGVPVIGWILWLPGINGFVRRLSQSNSMV